MTAVMEMGMRKRRRKWQHIIWRECRNCADEEYAKHLFEVVVDEPVGWGTTVTLVLLSALYGAMGGLLIDLIAINQNVAISQNVWNDLDKWELLSPRVWMFVWIGAGLGGCVALVIQCFSTNRPHTWRIFAARKYVVEAGGGYLVSMLIMIIGICVGVGYGMSSGSMSDPRLDPRLEFAGFIVIQWLLAMGLGLTLEAYGLYAGLLMQFFSGLFCGLGLGLLNYLSGGHEKWSFWLFYWLLIELFSGFSLCLFFFLMRGRSPNDEMNRYLPYKFAFGFGRFHPFKLEMALHQACADRDTARKIWSEPLRLLERRKSQPDSLDSLIANLQSSWDERFTAYHTLVAVGGEAVAPLCSIAVGQVYRPREVRRTVVWLLKSISEDTTLRLKKRASHLLCSHCLIHCNARPIRLSWRTSFTYYGCRVCGQSREFLSAEVVVVLDAGMPQPQSQHNGVLQVNWLLRRALFDFDQVEVIRATDEDVERFAVQVRNDTDAWRRHRYKKMHCVVAPGCKLSENTLRILRDQFRRVEYHT